LLIERTESVLVALGFGLASLVAASGCSDSGRPLVAPPVIAGAEFVGTDACAICHSEIAELFGDATHASLHLASAPGEEAGCEACHGAGSLHVEAGGGRGTIINPDRSPAACFGCHADVRGDFSLPHSHPVTGGPLDLTTGKIACSDCHEVHSGSAIRLGGASAVDNVDGCLECHPAQRGPFVYEHEALLEGCTACHQPHGSLNAALLTERNATLCLKCHFQEQTAAGTILIGGLDHSFFLSSGTCWSAGCHEAVHGSQVSSSLQF
jgi:predicted CXXCH cytochrome family protein